MFLRFEEIWCWSWICHGCSFFLFSSLQLLAAHHLRFKWDSNLQPFGVLHGGMTAYIAEGLASMGAQIASNWSRVAGIEMNVTHLQAASNGHKVMVKALPMRVGKRVQVWEILLPLLLLYGDGILLYSRHTFTSLVWTTSSFFWRVVKSTQCSKYWTSTRVKWQPTKGQSEDKMKLADEAEKLYKHSLHGTFEEAAHSTLPMCGTCSQNHHRQSLQTRWFTRERILCLEYCLTWWVTFSRKVWREGESLMGLEFLI